MLSASVRSARAHERKLEGPCTKRIIRQPRSFDNHALMCALFWFLRIKLLFAGVHTRHRHPPWPMPIRGHRTHRPSRQREAEGQTAPSITQHFIDRTLPASSHQFAGVFLPYSGCRAQRVIHCEDLRRPPADTLSENGSGWAA